MTNPLCVRFASPPIGQISVSAFRRGFKNLIRSRTYLGTYRGRSDLRTRWVETGAIWATGVRATF
jgi:hypothetical protein